jgi:hypothetical protein
VLPAIAPAAGWAGWSRPPPGNWPSVPVKWSLGSDDNRMSLLMGVSARSAKTQQEGGITQKSESIQLNPL